MAMIRNIMTMRNKINNVEMETSQKWNKQK
jgi:hypothetical protein